MALLRHSQSWQFILLIAGAATATHAAESSTVAAPAAESAAVAAPEPEEPLYAAPTQIDRIGRILAPVMINGKGPFRFVVDTGANRTTVSPRLLAELGLEVSPDQVQLVHGVTGSAYVPTVHIDRFQAGSLVMENVSMPVLETSVNANAHGILGVARLQHARVFVDFRRDKVTISRAHMPRWERRSYIVIDAARIPGGLLAVNARVRGVRAKAIIDTGAERTLGNMALRDAIRARHRRHDQPRTTEVYGATLQVSEGESEFTPVIQMGDVSINHVDITYGDFHIFDAWGLHDRPALLIGMDVLGVAEELVIDFPRTEVLVRGADPRNR